MITYSESSSKSCAYRLAWPKSPLNRDSRALRDSLEHFDERIEQWAVETADGNYFDMNIGPIGALPSLAMRQFDPETLTVEVMGETMALQPLMEVIGQLSQRAVAEGAEARKRIRAAGQVAAQAPPAE